MTGKAIALTLFLTISSVCLGKNDGRDSSYIMPYDNEFTAKVFLKDNFISMIREYRGMESTYKTNRPIGIGAGLYYRQYGLSFSYGFNFLRNSKKGNTKSLDLQYSHYGKSCLIDIIAQSHKGMYLDRKTDKDGYVTFPDMRICRVGINYMHIFNPDRFSFKSAFVNSEKQLKSAGTWYAGAEFSGGMVSGGNGNIFPDSDKKRITMFLVGPAGGYAYNWVLKYGFYINLSASLGVDMVWTNRIFNITPSAVVRTGIGFDNGKQAVFMNYRNNIIFPYIADTERLGVSSGLLTFGTLFRIRTIRI